MIICVEKSFIFIHIPKSSGTEMSAQLLKTYNCNLLQQVDPKTGLDKMHLHQDVIDKYISPDILSSFFKFCIVRNPYERLYSAWYFIKDRHGYDNVNDFIKEKLSKEFIFGKEMFPGDARVHYRPQYTFIYSDDGEIKVDLILRYESLNEDIAKMNKKTGLKIPEYGKFERYSKAKYTPLFNKDSIKKINDLYREDFYFLGYEMIDT